MSKHTVQDWQRTGTTVYALNAEGTNRFSALVQGGWITGGRLRTHDSELEANARLIAAAPDLLKAAREMVEMREYAQRGLLHPYRHELDIVNDARAAIAKATQP